MREQRMLSVVIWDMLLSSKPVGVIFLIHSFCVHRSFRTAPRIYSIKPGMAAFKSATCLYTWKESNPPGIFLPSSKTCMVA